MNSQTPRKQLAKDSSLPPLHKSRVALVGDRQKEVLFPPLYSKTPMEIDKQVKRFKSSLSLSQIASPPQAHFMTHQLASNKSAAFLHS